MSEQLKLNLFFLIYPLVAIGLMLLQVGYGISPKFNDMAGKFISSFVLVLSCVSLHLIQGAFNQFANVLTAAIAFYFVANFLPNWGMGVPAFRNAANSADLSAAEVAKISSRFLFMSLALFTVLYVFFSLAGSNIPILPSANNAYRKIIKTEIAQSA